MTSAENPATDPAKNSAGGPARNVVALPRRTALETAFLPAALEVIETPPSPTARLLGGAILAAFCIALCWAIIGSVDIIAVAPGKIVPSSRIKLIQPFEIGVVRAIHVKDGDKVKAGELLIELDPTMSAAEMEHLKADLLAARLDVARLQAALADGDSIASFQPPAEASPVLVEIHRGFLVSQVTEQHSKMAEIDRQIAQKRAEHDTVAAAIGKLEATIPVLKQRLDIRKDLFDRALGSKINYLNDLQDFLGQQHDLEVQKSRALEADAAVATLAETRAKTVEQFRHAVFDDLAKAEQKAAGLAQDVIKAQQRTNYQALTAPVDGTVQQLAVHTIGGVVTPAQSLAVVVPFDTRLEIEANIFNRDIGFVAEGQQAQIKVDTFPFTRYGLLHGTVLSVSGDSITRNKPQDPNDNARGNTGGVEIPTSEPKGQELVYSARVSLDRTEMHIDERTVALTPGMAVTVEIATGRRRVISYLLSPLARYAHDALHER